jgi:hypothetical protein
MAKVEMQEVRHQEAHYGLYRTALGGDERVIVRRKCGEKTDYQHGKSQRVKRQRERLATASRHWNSLTPSQKNYWRNQIGFVKREGSPSAEVLLKGRELFIAQDINSLAATGKRITTPYEICLVLCDEEHTPLSGALWLSYYQGGEWHICFGESIGFGQWLYTKVPRGKEFYRVTGTAIAYYDPKLPEHQWMTEQYLLSYHYHVLLFNLELVFLEPWDAIASSPPMELVKTEPWNVQHDPPEFERVILEPWTN